jgi:hypothetical protein
MCKNILTHETIALTDGCEKGLPTPPTGNDSFMSDFLHRVKKFVDQHDDKVDEALERAGDEINKRTGGKYEKQVNKGVDYAQKHTGKGGSDKSASI